MEIKTEKEEEKKGEMVFMSKSNLGTCTLPPRGQKACRRDFSQFDGIRG